MFSMWMDPKHIVELWGPTGFTSTIHEMDVRVGGAWRHTMHVPDGVDYKNDSVYLEVTRPRKLLYDHLTGGFRATVLFSEKDGKTTVVLFMVFQTSELRDREVKDHNAIEGAN